MGLDGMPEQKARTEFSAEPALVACGAADPLDLGPRSIVATDERMHTGQDNDAARRFRDRYVKAGRWSGHHHASEEDAEIRGRGSSGGREYFTDADADGSANCNRVRDRSRDGKVFMGDRLIEADVDEGFDVRDNGIDVFG
jgi:hypothetical protein